MSKDHSIGRVRSLARQPTEIDVRIGQRIRERRQILGLRQEDLARLLGIVPHQLQKYENGENRIAASRLVECARVLEIPMVWFYQTLDCESHPPGAEAQLPGEELELLECYRQLAPKERMRLLGIARLLIDDRPAPRRKSRRT